MADVPRIVYADQGELVEVFTGVYLRADFTRPEYERTIYQGDAAEPGVIVKPRHPIPDAATNPRKSARRPKASARTRSSRDASSCK
jgi:hypothetical protein